MATIYSLETDLAAETKRADDAEVEVRRGLLALEQRDMVLATVKGDVDLAFDDTADGNARAYARERIRAALNGCALMAVSVVEHQRIVMMTADSAQKHAFDLANQRDASRTRLGEVERQSLRRLQQIESLEQDVDALRADNERLRDEADKCRADGPAVWSGFASSPLKVPHDEG